jgi:hypothetical protein
MYEMTDVGRGFEPVILVIAALSMRNMPKTFSKMMAKSEIPLIS